MHRFWDPKFLEGLFFGGNFGHLHSVISESVFPTPSPWTSPKSKWDMKKETRKNKTKQHKLPRGSEFSEGKIRFFPMSTVISNDGNSKKITKGLVFYTVTIVLRGGLSHGWQKSTCLLRWIEVECKPIIWVVVSVSIQLKKMCINMGIFPSVRVKINNLWNHHLVIMYLSIRRFSIAMASLKQQLHFSNFIIALSLNVPKYTSQN